MQAFSTNILRRAMEIDEASKWDLISFMVETLLEAGEYSVKSSVIEFAA